MNDVSKYRNEDLKNMFLYIIQYIREHRLMLNDLDIDAIAGGVEPAIKQFIHDGLGLIANAYVPEILDLYLEQKAHSLMNAGADANAAILVKYVRWLIYHGKLDECEYALIKMI